MYEKQEFLSGQPLKASQLDKMEDGIIEAQELASKGAAGAANMEKGSGKNATQQQLDTLTVDFTDRNPNATTLFPELKDTFNTGATGPYTASLNGNTMALGSRAFAVNNKTMAKGDESFAQGYQSVALGGSSMATGSKTTAAGMGAHAGGVNTVALGEGSYAGGYCSVARGLYSHAEGSNTQANKQSAHAEGGDTVADGEYAHAEGGNTKAAGMYSHSEGVNTLASNRCSHAQGHATVASGDGAHAQGDNTIAKGNYSHAGGSFTIAGYDYQTVIGTYNNNQADTLFEIGNGTETIPSNAFEVYKDGHAELDVVGNTNKSVITKEYLTNNSSCVYTHHFEIVLTWRDSPMISVDGEARIFVNAISSSPTPWKTLKELDGNGYIISAFGYVTKPEISIGYIIELKLFHSQLNVLLLNIHNTDNSSVHVSVLSTCGGGQSPGDYQLIDSVTKI